MWIFPDEFDVLSQFSLTYQISGLAATLTLVQSYDVSKMLQYFLSRVNPLHRLTKPIFWWKISIIKSKSQLINQPIIKPKGQQKQGFKLLSTSLGTPHVMQWVGLVLIRYCIFT